MSFITGSGVLEAGVLLKKVGGDAGQAAVGIAFADKNAAMHVVADDDLGTSRIDTADLQVKMRNGSPVKLGQGTACWRDSYSGSCPETAFYLASCPGFLQT